ncbi:MAG: sortase [Chloroflexota bacterium]
MLVIILLSFAGLACRLEIGVGQVDAAQSEVSNLPPLAVSAAGLPSAASSPPSALPTETKPDGFENEATEVAPETGNSVGSAIPVATSTPPPPSPTPTLTPTPTPLPPAQSPPERIVIPAINLDAPVKVTTWTVVEQGGKQSSVWVVPDDAAGWHANSALPGHGSNVVFSSHHNIGTEVFRYLVDLQPGDKVILKADGRDYPYTVTDRFILPERGVPEEQRQQNARWILPTVDERVTLVTCWPYSGNSHRLIVIAKPGNF